MPAVDVAAGVLLIILLFCCVEEKSDHGRRKSNPGPERSKPKALTTALPCPFLVSVEWRYLLSSAATVCMDLSIDDLHNGFRWETYNHVTQGILSTRLKRLTVDKLNNIFRLLKTLLSPQDFPHPDM